MSEKSDVEAKISALEEALKGNNIEDIKTKKDELLKASQNIAVKAYQKAQAANPNNNNGNNNNQGSSNGNDDAVDAEFTESK